MPSLIFKIEDQSIWREAEEAGVYEGAPVDLADGFIHFSDASQVQGTLSKYFHGRKDLLLIAVDADGLGDALKWEISRGGALFPHLYGNLTMESVVESRPIPDSHDLSAFVDWGIA